MAEQGEQATVVHLPASPPVTRRTLRTELAREDTTRRQWRSCCLTCDKPVVLYLTKTAFSAVTLCFALYQIGSNKDPCNPNMSWYTGLVGMVAGAYIEQGAVHMSGRRAE